MSTNWFERKLSGQPAPAPAQLPETNVHQQALQRAAPPADPNAEPGPGDPGSLSHALATGQTKGDMAARTEHDSCPGCGGNYYFSRKNAGGARPQCYECGYPVVQYSSEMGEGSAIQTTRGIQ